MSHGVVRGEASAVQLHFDRILNDLLREKGVDLDAMQRSKVTVAQLLFYCMKSKWADDNIFIINGVTSETITANEHLKFSVSLARSLVVRGASGKTVVVLMRNHQRTAAVYFAVLFAGVVPFYMDPNGTAHEIKYYLELIEPCFVFCDREQYDMVTECLEGSDKVTAAVVVAEDEQELRQFAAGASDDVDSFQVSDANPEDAVIMLPTSGSTGLPKAALLNNKGLLVQLYPAFAAIMSKSNPIKLMMVLTTVQWISFTIALFNCVLNRIPILMTPKKITPEHVAEMLLKFRPTTTVLGPLFGKLLLSVVTPDHLSSIKYIQLAGAHATAEFVSALKAKLPETAKLSIIYGLTETHGIVAMSEDDAPLESSGRVSNLFQYKLINEDDVQVMGAFQQGELYLKGDCIIKGYYKNDSSYAESNTADGWFKTGDVFYIDENERLYYKERKNISFKHLDCHVSPEEVERVVCSVPGVKECVVCGTDRGPAAAVMLQDGCEVTREQIHHAVDSTLSDHKRLSGGIAFVTSLPLTHSGKFKRVDCLNLIKQLMESGQCF